RHICFTSHLVLHLCASLRRRHPRPTLFPTRRSSDLELIAGSLGTTPVLDRLPMQPGDVRRTYADVSKARRLLGYEPTTPVEVGRSEEHTSELQSRENLVCRLLLEKKKYNTSTSLHRE